LKLIDLLESDDGTLKTKGEVRDWIKDWTMSGPTTNYKLSDFKIEMTGDKANPNFIITNQTIYFTTTEFPKNVKFDVEYAKFNRRYALSNSGHGKVTEEIIVKNLKFLSEHFLPSRSISIHFNLDAVIKSFDGVNEIPGRPALGFYPRKFTTNLPKTGWRELFKYKLKQQVKVHQPDARRCDYSGREKKDHKILKIFNESQTLLEFQSALIDQDLESWF
jgi:hypothetical protein